MKRIPSALALACAMSGMVACTIDQPRIMNKAVSVPGPLVLIGAMVGATLMGLLGALVAVPITASLLIVINSVVIPKQDAKV